MIELLVVSFFAGILTTLTPCVLPFLPVIIGGSLTNRNIKRPLLITSSLALSILFFTLILKASTALIMIPQSFWSYFSASIISIFALTLIFPKLWSRVIHIISPNADAKLLTKVNSFARQDNTLSSILLGVALGPVFASCSPTYFLILGTVLPSSFLQGVLYLFTYAIGLSISLFLAAFGGQQLLSSFKTFANPNNWFKKALGVLILIVGIAIFTGYDKKLEAYLLRNGDSKIVNFEQTILDNLNNK